VKAGDNASFDAPIQMTISFAGLLFALAGFAAAFAAARALAKWVKRRRARRSEQAALQDQSRQVRRAKARAAKRQ
jgi:hypothetical protein